jgi:hypothetical protein
VDLYAAPECAVRLEVRAEQPLRLRPACPLGFSSTHGAVRALLAQAGAAREARLHFGRIVEYPWLSELLARQASASRLWNPASGEARGLSPESYVATALRGMPEFTVLFDRWDIESISVEKVLLKPAAALPMPAGFPFPPESRLPYDALLMVVLRR